MKINLKTRTCAAYNKIDNAVIYVSSVQKNNSLCVRLPAFSITLNEYEPFLYFPSVSVTDMSVPKIHVIIHYHVE